MREITGGGTISIGGGVNGDGGAIALTATTGNITTGNISSSSDGAGGNVNLSAQNDIEVTTIAVGDEEAELGFAGLAHQAGVKSAVGSLWYVSDAGTLALMSQFYEQLQEVPIKAEALRQAQLAMISGQVTLEDGEVRTPRGSLAVVPEEGDPSPEIQLSHPYFWSAFTTIGNPW